MREPSFREVATMMRLEVAKVVGRAPVWFLLDWVKDETELPKQMMRVLERFNRIALSLDRQSQGRRARNEPYSDVVGVRVKMGNRLIGVWPKGPQDAQLLVARTATASEHTIESSFATWLAARAQSSRGAGEQPVPPPARDSSAESKARRPPQSPDLTAAVTDGSNVDRK